MRFTLRGLFLVVTLLATWCGLMVHGHRRLGFGGVVVFGTFFGISLILLGAMVRRWQEWSVAERIMCFIALTLSMGAGMFMVMMEFRTARHR
jgi:hypothetical protein